MSIDEKTQTELEAAAFRRLVSHLRERPDVQERGLDLDYDAAREIVYGMPYAEWKDKYQTEATAEQKAAFAESHKAHE